MRIRTIKPEFFNHEGIYDAEKETILPLRIAFAGLWCAADREGRFKWEPRRLKTQVLPYDEVDFSRVLDALVTRGFLLKYASGTGVYGYIPSFAEHQVINNREKHSNLPNPNDCNVCDALITRQPRVSHACKEEGKGREGKGKEGETKVSLVRSQAPDERIELIWESVPSEARVRSTQKKLQAAWTRIPKTQQPTIEVLTEALDAWNGSQQWKDGYAAGCHIWVSDRKYEVLPPNPSNRRSQACASAQENDSTGKFMGGRQLNFVKIES